ncbi:hypothetical protein L0Y65_03670 [Candidatus Micrarchaeota archaeon]|nr:hypothetical protein [Candidatus Micrarchaeota archaeon]
MAIRRELLLIIALILVIAALIKIIEFFQVNVVEADASKFVIEDLNSKYPGSDVAIMTIVPKTNDNGARYFEVKAKVTENPLSPCPERSHIFYNYPAQNFIPQPAEVITSGCKVCTEGICTIAFAEEAVIASHTFPGTGAVTSYIHSNEGASPSVAEKPDEESWLVKWDAPGAASYFLVYVHRNGTVLSLDEGQKN